MTQPANNIRVRRTQKMLREALIDLIEERGFDAITVGEIAERAMISRATFYRSYQDKYDLVEQIFAEAMHALLTAMSNSGKEHPPQVWFTFFDHIVEYERLYRALLGRKGSPWFVHKMRVSMVTLVKEYGHLPRWQPADGPGHAMVDEFIPDLIATMFLEAITWWLENGRPFSTREMATRCAQLFTAIYQETSTWQ